MLDYLSRNRLLIVAIVFWVLILMISRQIMLDRQLTFMDIANQLADVLTQTWYGPLLFIFVYMLRPLILFPASLLTLLGGSVFGLFPGFFYILIAGTVSALLPYGAARWFSDEPAEQVTDGNRLSRFIGLLRRNPFQAVLIMRLLYLPYDLVSVLAGSLKINTGTFFLATLIGNIGGTLAYTGLGASIEGDLSTGSISFDPSLILFSTVVLIIGLALSRFLNQLNLFSSTQQDTQ